MKLRLVIRPQAEADLRDAQDWYENQRVGLGREFLVQTGITIQRLLRNPELHPDYYRGFRRVMMIRFPSSL